MPPLLSDEESAIDPYILLELGPQATDKEVDRAFRRKSLKYHSDKVSLLTPSSVLGSLHPRTRVFPEAADEDVELDVGSRWENIQ